MKQKSILNGANILITGGTGSIGKKLTQVILANYRPKRLVIYSRDELKQYEMSQVYNPSKYECIRYFIGDIRDKERLYRAFHGIDYIIHAAALKQVPAAEYNPFEAVKTNILGTQNIINASIDQGIKRVVALSTDKAANPVNLYGATKLCSDKLIIAGNSYVGKEKCRLSVVRYGNVMASRGSVIPLFMEQKKTGAVTVTDKRMTRFWITKDNAAQFILNVFNLMDGGELFVPKIPSMNIMDLASAVAPECKVRITGIRPGEKLHEIMIGKDDARNTLEFENFYIIQPEFDFWLRSKTVKKGKKVKDSFEYSSDRNPWFLSTDEMRRLINRSEF